MNSTNFRNIVSYSFESDDDSLEISLIEGLFLELSILFLPMSFI